MASTDVTAELVENALQNENFDMLKRICCDLTKKLQSCDFLVGQEFFEQIGRTLHRDICFDRKETTTEEFLRIV